MLNSERSALKACTVVTVNCEYRPPNDILVLISLEHVAHVLLFGDVPKVDYCERTEQPSEGVYLLTEEMELCTQSKKQHTRFSLLAVNR